MIICLVLISTYAFVGLMVVRIASEIFDGPVLKGGNEGLMLTLSILTWPMQLLMILSVSIEAPSHRRDELRALELERKRLLADCSIGGPDIPRILKIEKEIEALQNCP